MHASTKCCTHSKRTRPQLTTRVIHDTRINPPGTGREAQGESDEHPMARAHPVHNSHVRGLRRLLHLLEHDPQRPQSLESKLLPTVLLCEYAPDSEQTPATTSPPLASTLTRCVKLSEPRTDCEVLVEHLAHFGHCEWVARRCQFVFK